jgi:hypothetical protein
METWIAPIWGSLMALGRRYYKATPHEYCDSTPACNGLASTSHFGFCVLQPSGFGVTPHRVKRRNVSLPGRVVRCWSYDRRPFQDNILGPYRPVGKICSNGDAIDGRECGRDVGGTTVSQGIKGLGLIRYSRFDQYYDENQPRSQLKRRSS